MANVVPFAITGCCLAALVAINFELMKPIIAPFAWALIISLPLHTIKTWLVDLAMGPEPKVDELNQPADRGLGRFAFGSLGEFVFGPLFSLFRSILEAYHRTLSSFFSSISSPTKTSFQKTPVADGSNEKVAKEESSSKHEENSKAVASSAEPADPLKLKKTDYALWAVQWSIRVSFLSILWSVQARRNCLVVGATVLCAHAGFVVFGQGQGRRKKNHKASVSEQRSKKRAAWNDSITSSLIWASLLGITGTTVYFGNEVVRSLPIATSQLASFVSIPPASLSSSLSSDFGIRSSLSQHVPTIRSILLSTLDSKLNETFPAHNISASEVGSIVAAGIGTYDAYLGRVELFAEETRQHHEHAVESFRSRFTLISDALRHAAGGDMVAFLGAIGPALGEVRAHGVDAFRVDIDPHFKKYHEVRRQETGAIPESRLNESASVVDSDKQERKTISPEEIDRLDPTSELPSILGPKILDLLFSSLVFFSTLGTFVASEKGLKGYLADFLGYSVVESVVEPLSISLSLNVRLFTFRILISYLINEVILGDLSLALIPSPLSPHSTTNPLLPLASISPWIAFVSSWAPMAPPLVTLGLPLAFLMYTIVDGSGIRALLVVVVHLWAAAVAEGAIILDAMGDDGIPALDGFAFWCGWFRFDAPWGLILGPWAFMAFRRCIKSVGKLRVLLEKK
ncbi:hypothetical protein HDU97_005956 [Phlyctochytrium planicorne]|nr:hypothetical protein HDU97_005956 [Phlyctochytrium planicorne]